VSPPPPAGTARSRGSACRDKVALRRCHKSKHHRSEHGQHASHQGFSGCHPSLPVKSWHGYGGGSSTSHAGAWSSATLWVRVRLQWKRQPGAGRMPQIFVCKDVEMRDGDVRIVRQDRSRSASTGMPALLCLPQPLPASGRSRLRGRAEGRVVESARPDKTYIGQTYDHDDPHIVCPWHGWEYKLRTGEWRPTRACGSSATRWSSAREASMSSSDILDRPAEALKHASDRVGRRLADPERIPTPPCARSSPTRCGSTPSRRRPACERRSRLMAAP
jgi:hypothetical protein